MFDRTILCTATVCLTAAVLLQTAPPAAAQAAASTACSIELLPPTGDKPHRIAVVGIDAATREASADGTLAANRLLTVRVAGDDAPPVLGQTVRQGDRLVFEPRFPLTPGLPHRVEFRLRGEVVATASVTIPLPAPAGGPARLEAIYPSDDVLPENLLRFYLHFSVPMARGEAYDNVRLLDSAGRAIADPFLTLSEELWDTGGSRFTLLLDPGRVKQDLKPNVEVGPVLMAGRSYTLVIDRAWRDAEGRRLAETFRKPFRTSARDDGQPDTARWEVAPPAAGGHDPLTVRLNEPLDHALLQRLVRVESSGGDRLEGEVTVADNERLWRFTPRSPWVAGGHRLRVDAALEDRCGNSLGRPFEVRLGAETTPRQADESAEAHTVGFVVR